MTRFPPRCWELPASRDVCAGVKPLAASSLTLLILFAVPVSAAPSPAEKELYEIGAILGGAQALTGPRREEEQQDQDEQLAAEAVRVARRLDLFELRFGQPDRMWGWRNVQRPARRLLRRLPRGRDCRSPWWSRAPLARSILLELAGQPKRARRVIERTPASFAGACGGADWDSHSELRLQRTRLLQRKGDAAGALREMDEIWEGSYTNLDLFLCRRALLLTRLRKYTSARAQLQRVLDIFPTSRGARIARTRLGAAALTRPSPKRLAAIVITQAPFERVAAMTTLRQLVPEAAAITVPTNRWDWRRRRAQVRALLRTALRKHRRRGVEKAKLAKSAS